MKEVIKKPAWKRDNINKVYSKSIDKFAKIYNIKSYDDIDIELLRNYYRLDKEACINLIDEFILRGYKFILNKPSQLIPEVEYNDTQLGIKVKEDNNTYLNINYEKLGLINLIRRFDIDNNYFFDGIKLDYFKYLNRDINISVLIEELKRNDFEIVDIINEYEDKKYENEYILKWDTNEYIHSDNINISEEDKVILRGIIDSKLNEEDYYININSIYNTVKLKLRSLFKDNNIKNSNNLLCILKFSLRDFYQFRRNVIFDSSVNLDEKFDIFEEYIKSREIINYEEFLKYFTDKKFSKNEVYKALQRVTKQLLQINVCNYIRKEDLILKEKDKNEIRKFLDKHFINKEYIVLVDIDNYEELPNLEYEWSEYLLSDIIKEYFDEYRIICKFGEDRRYRRPIVVKEISKIMNITDLIIYIIKNEYKDFEGMTKSRLEHYLFVNNIVFKKIPKEFYESEKISVDKFDRIQILGSS